MKNKRNIKLLEPGTRERLLETASHLFAEKGYASTSVREIVARAGVSKPVLYYYFQSKEGLYYAILKWGAEVQKKIIDDVFEASGTVQDRIIFLYRRIYEEIQAYQGLYKMIHGLIYGPPQGAPGYDFPIYHRQMFNAVKRICFEGLSSATPRTTTAACLSRHKPRKEELNESSQDFLHDSTGRTDCAAGNLCDDRLQGSGKYGHRRKQLP
jgi:AcrR family transcriptional regulator